MIRYLLIALPVILLCLVLQAVLVSVCLHYYSRFRASHTNRHSTLADAMVLSVVMMLTLLGNWVQIAIWALLFMVLGEFQDFGFAFYHSSVNFVTLGYGDIVMSEKWRLLGPLEAANGILMFGVSTAVMTAAVMDVIKHSRTAKANPGNSPE